MLLLTILGASLIGSFFALIGGTILLIHERTAKRLSLVFVSFAAGSLLGAAFFELIPESLETLDPTLMALGVIAGIIALFLFEKGLKWYHCHDRETCDLHTFSGSVLAGDTIHNFIDGVIIALSFSVSPAAGVATTIAVFFHEVPQEIGDFGVLLHSGYAKRRIVMLNLMTALATTVGALAGYFALPFLTSALPYLLAFAAGSFLYISISDLIPELRHRTRGNEFWHVIAMLLGLASIWFVGVFVAH